MWLVVDTNQAGFVPPGSRITLAPFVLAELLLHRNTAPRRLLASCHIRFGMEPLPMFERLALLDAAAIERFEPFFAVDGDEHRMFHKALTSPDAGAFAWARKRKDEHLSFCANMMRIGPGSRARLRSAGEPTPRVGSIEAAQAVAPSFLEAVVVEVISNGGQRQMTAEQAAAAMRNHHLRGMFHSILTYVFSFSYLWDHARRRQNFEAAADRDDVTDMVLPLYAGPGDVIVTADKKLRQVVELVYPTSDVRAVTAAEVRATPSSTAGEPPSSGDP